MRRPSDQRPVGVRLVDVLTPTFPPSVDVRATSCSIDADRVRPGDVYFAPNTEAADALPGVERALAAGAKAVVTGQFLPISGGAPQLVVDDPRAAFGRFCHALVGRPCDSLNTVAVTGGQGERSVARLLQSICRAAGRDAALASDGARFDGAQTRPFDNKHATAATMASWLANSAANGCTDAIVEAASRTVGDGRFDGAEFRVVCLTGSCGAPAAIEDTLNRLAGGAVLVANADDPDCCRGLSRRLGSVLTYGFSDAADLRGRVIERHTAGQVLLIRHGAQTVAVETSTVGDAHARSCLAAAATALTLGMTLAEAAAGIEAAKPAPLAMQPVVCGQAFPVYLDAARDPSAVAGAARSVSAVATRRVLTVVAAPTQSNNRRRLIDAARSVSDLVIAAGETDKPIEGVRCVDDAFSALALALALAEAGDAVLVVGCRRGDQAPSDEELVVRQLLELRLRNEEELTAAG